MAGKPQNLRKHGNVWHAHLKVNGQRVHFSTRATDLATARKVLEEKRRELLQGQYSLSKRVLPTLDQIWSIWWEGHQTIFSPGHLSSVECRFRRWVKPSLGALRVDLISTEAVMGLRSRQLESGCSGRYSNNTLELLRTLLRFAIRLGHIEKLPFAVKPLRLQRKPRPTVPSQGIAPFLALTEEVARNPHVAVMLCTLVALGLREAELLGMRWEWFDPNQRTYTVGRAKGKEARVLPIPDWLWGRLLKMPRAIGEWVFPAKDGKPHRSGYLRKPLARLAEKGGYGH